MNELSLFKKVFREKSSSMGIKYSEYQQKEMEATIYQVLGANDNKTSCEHSGGLGLFEKDKFMTAQKKEKPQPPPQQQQQQQQQTSAFAGDTTQDMEGTGNWGTLSSLTM